MFISLAINPTTYIVIFLLLGVVLKSKRWKRLCLTLSALLFLLFSNGALYQWIAEQWYKEYDRPLPERKQYTYGIVLGGYSYWDWKRSRPEFSEIADRLLEGIRLYKHGRIRKLVLASDGSIIESKDRKGLQGNAADMKQYLADLGMPLEDVILETRTNNTWENATFTLELIGNSMKTESTLLITSATHMRRSLWTFHAAGLNPDTYITDTFPEIKGEKNEFPAILARLGFLARTNARMGGVSLLSFTTQTICMKPKVIRISTVPLSLHLLLQGQLKMLAETYEVLAVSSSGEELHKVAEREGVRTCAIPMERHIAPLKDLIALIRLIILFHKEKPQIVHSLTPKAGLLAMMAARICRVPIRIHTFTGLVFPSTTGWKQQLLIATDKLTCACATYLNPEGKGVRRDLERFHITSRALHLIGNGNINGIDLAYFDRTPEVMRQAEIYRRNPCFTFCFVGRLVRDKGINELVSAFVRLQQEFTNCRLCLVGDFEAELDPVTPETAEHIHKHPAIKFMGWQEDIRPFLAAADAFVFPSYREGFPNVILQAGAMGLPCIVTNINGCNEIIENGKNGIIIPPHDSEYLYRTMCGFLSSPRLVEQLASAARPQIVQKYDRRTLWEALRKVYQEQISNLTK